MRHQRPSGIQQATPWLLVPTLLLASCAKLRIDVDVYKGPLANDETVQIEQIAAMAIGAKPLLIELRDELEGRERFPGRANSGALLREQGWLADDYVPKPSDSPETISSDRYPFFKNPHARRVNSLLSLYEDQHQGEVPETVVTGLAAFESFERARALVLVDPEIDAELWREVVVAYEESEGHFEELAEKSPGISQQRRALREAYRGFLLPGKRKDGRYSFRDQNALLKAHLSLLEAATNDEVLRRLSKPEIPIVSGVPIMASKTVDELGANVIFEALADPAVATAHARLLFAEPKGRQRSLAERFVSRVEAISAAFGESRSDLAEVWRSAALFLATDSDLDIPQAPALRFAARRAVARLASPDLLWAAAHNSNLPESLRLVASDGQTEANQPDAIRRVSDQLQKVQNTRQDSGKTSEPAPDEGKGSPGAQDLESTYRAYFDDMELELEKAPVRVSTWLLVIDEAFRNGLALPEGMRSEYDEYLDSERIEGYSKRDSEALRAARRQYGTVIGPASVDDEEAQRITSRFSEEAFRELDRSVTALQGLDGGRLLIGLESLIENYVDAAYESPGNPTSLNEKRRLLDGLVRFAEKLRFLAGFQSLLYEWKDYESADQILTKNSDVLSAVANSILSQVDAIAASDRFAEQQKERARLEWSGQDQACKCLVCDQVDKAGEPTFESPRQVMDAVIARLRHEFIRCVEREGQDSQEAKKYREALDVAYAERSGMIFVRPAVAFLRNSYVTTGADESDQSPRDRVGLRPIGEAQAHSGRIPDPEVEARARTLEDIDEQFWQTVNTVKLGGPGSSSYVVVKDDIGNWYVKSYKATTEKIIETAKNLAMFAAAGSISPVALVDAQKILAMQPGDPMPELQSNQVEDVQLMQTLLKNERSTSEKAAKQAYDALREEASKLEAELLTKLREDERLGDTPAERTDNLAWLRTALDTAEVTALPEEISAEEAPEKLRAALEELKSRGEAYVRAISEPVVKNAAYDFLSEKDALDHELNEAGDDFASGPTLEQVEGDIAEHEEAIESNREQLEQDQEARQKDARDALKGLQDEKAKKETEVTRHEAALSDLRTQLLEEESKVDPLAEAITALRQRQGELTNQIAETEDEEERAALEQELNEVTAELQEREADLEALNEDIEDRRQAIEAAEESLEQAKGQVTAAEGNIHEQEAEVEKLSDASLRADLERLETELESLREERESLEALIQALKLQGGQITLDDAQQSAAKEIIQKAVNDILQSTRSKRLSTIRNHVGQLQTLLEAASPKDSEQ